MRADDGYVPSSRAGGPSFSATASCHDGRPSLSVDELRGLAHQDAGLGRGWSAKGATAAPSFGSTLAAASASAMRHLRPDQPTAATYGRCDDADVAASREDEYDRHRHRSYDGNNNDDDDDDRFHQRRDSERRRQRGSQAVRKDGTPSLGLMLAVAVPILIVLHMIFG